MPGSLHGKFPQTQGPPKSSIYRFNFQFLNMCLCRVYEYRCIQRPEEGDRLPETVCESPVLGTGNQI